MFVNMHTSSWKVDRTHCCHGTNQPPYQTPKHHDCCHDHNVPLSNGRKFKNIEEHNSETVRHSVISAVHSFIHICQGLLKLYVWTSNSLNLNVKFSKLDIRRFYSVLVMNRLDYYDKSYCPWSNSVIFPSKHLYNLSICPFERLKLQLSASKHRTEYSNLLILYVYAYVSDNNILCL